MEDFNYFKVNTPPPPKMFLKRFHLGDHIKLYMCISLSSYICYGSRGPSAAQERGASTPCPLSRVLVTDEGKLCQPEESDFGQEEASLCYLD